MKCPVCDGTGEVANYHKIEFDEPTEPQTNEERFCQLPTEGKAEIIAQLSSYGGNVDAILDLLKAVYKE